MKKSITHIKSLKGLYEAQRLFRNIKYFVVIPRTGEVCGSSNELSIATRVAKSVRGVIAEITECGPKWITV